MLTFKTYFQILLCSYGRNYKRLLECMIKNDMALKGNLDGIDLLIFYLIIFLKILSRQERDTRKQDMNLKPCFQESSEHIVDQERESKNSRVSKNSADRFPFGRNGVSPTTFSEDNFRKCGEYDVSKSSTEGQVPKNKLKKQGVMPSFLGEMDNKINQEKHSEPQTNKNNKDGDEDPLLLSLSLAFPFSNQV
ncbi:hypothetical protein CFP56_014363 [Quercus suber]|uniref:Uncharacterized protein n=1 Tax=Quercus suber TaxID=58331 RepID=A0AAW0KU23_QUESU